MDDGFRLGQKLLMTPLRLNRVRRRERERRWNSRRGQAIKDRRILQHGLKVRLVFSKGFKKELDAPLRIEV